MPSVAYWGFSNGDNLECRGRERSDHVQGSTRRIEETTPLPVIWVVADLDPVTDLVTHAIDDGLHWAAV